MKNHNVVYATLRNITLRKKNETAIVAHKNRLYRLANHDKLTGLPNRMYFSEQLEQAMSKAKRHNTMLSLLFIDLDRFKPINDSLGHAVGDKVLQEVSARLQGVIRKEDSIARLGGDEFIVLMENLIHENEGPPDSSFVHSGKFCSFCFNTNNCNDTFTTNNQGYRDPA